MDIKVYPAVFMPQDEGGYTIQFYDVDGCVSEGDTVEEATVMAQDALGGVLVSMEEEGANLPAPTDPSKIIVDDGEFIVMISIDMDEFRRKYGQRAVKKTLTIPAWLNNAAEEAHINFSSVLQEALKKQLQV